MSTWWTIIRSGRIMRQAFREQRVCMHDVYQRMAPSLCSPEGTPSAYEVRAGLVPASFYSWRRNLFSTLFHAVYLLLDCPEPRRQLYGRLIHLYRIWVTAADNLLDNEDKVVVPIEMPGASRIMRQVVAVMAADRALSAFLDEAVAAGVISRETAACLQRESLRRLLPSAAEEAAEEGGVETRPAPEHVLNVIHRLKTGLLFNIAFAAPEIAEPGLNPRRLAALKDALMQFGLGCQLLDDVRDLGKDLLESRHNYLLSWLAHHQPDDLPLLQKRAESGVDRLYLHAPRCAALATEQGFAMIRQGLARLGREGLEFDEAAATRMASFMFTVLDLEGIRHAA